MNKEITIKIGGIYSMVERPQQVLVMAPGATPKVFSHDREILTALRDATNYIKYNHVELTEFKNQLK